MSRDENRTATLITLAMAAFILFSAFMLGWNMKAARCQQNNTADTIYVQRTDTVTLLEVRADTLIQYIDRLQPVTVHDTIRVSDTLYISMPYEFRHYSQPDTLDVWYSGINPHIDSARVYMRTVTKIIGKPYEVVKPPQITLDFGIAGYYSARQVNPYLFTEIRYNAKKTTFSAFGAINHEGEWGMGAAVAYRLVGIQ